MLGHESMVYWSSAFVQLCLLIQNHIIFIVSLLVWDVILVFICFIFQLRFFRIVRIIIYLILKVIFDLIQIIILQSLQGGSMIICLQILSHFQVLLKFRALFEGSFLLLCALDPLEEVEVIVNERSVRPPQKPAQISHQVSLWESALHRLCYTHPLHHLICPQSRNSARIDHMISMQREHTYGLCNGQDFRAATERPWDSQSQFLRSLSSPFFSSCGERYPCLGQSPQSILTPFQTRRIPRRTFGKIPSLTLICSPRRKIRRRLTAVPDSILVTSVLHLSRNINIGSTVFIIGSTWRTFIWPSSAFSEDVNTYRGNLARHTPVFVKHPFLSRLILNSGSFLLLFFGFLHFVFASSARWCSTERKWVNPPINHQLQVRNHSTNWNIFCTSHTAQYIHLWGKASGEVLGESVSAGDTWNSSQFHRHCQHQGVKVLLSFFQWRPRENHWNIQFDVSSPSTQINLSLKRDLGPNKRSRISWGDSAFIIQITECKWSVSRPCCSTVA